MKFFNTKDSNFDNENRSRIFEKILCSHESVVILSTHIINDSFSNNEYGEGNG